MTWVLCRGNYDPLVGQFASREDAEDWALDHGLVDWRACESRHPEHEQVCARCWEPWPCRHVRLDRKAARIIHEAENACARCGKQIGWMKITIKGDGDLGQDVHYHGRKGACRNAALRRLAELGTPDALRELARIRRQTDWNDAVRAHQRRAVR